MKVFVAALAQDIQELNQIGFFVQLEAERKVQLTEKFGQDFNTNLLSYLSQVKTDQLWSDLTQTVVQLKSGGKIESKLVRAIGGFLAEDVLPAAEDYHFNNQSGANLTKLQESSKGSALYAAAYGAIIGFDYHRLARSLSGLITKSGAYQKTVVQLAGKPGAEFRNEVRADLTKKGEVPVFMVNQGILGGIRLFAKNKSTDNSWVTQVKNLTQAN